MVERFLAKNSEELLDLYRRILEAHASTPPQTGAAVAQKVLLQAAERELTRRGSAKALDSIRQDVRDKPRRIVIDLSKDVLQVLAERPGITLHVKVEAGEDLGKWKSQIEVEGRKIFAEVFDLAVDDIQLSVYLLPGSVWTNIQPALNTMALILGLYVGIHEAAPLLKKDFQRISAGIVSAVEAITGGEVVETESFPLSDRYWQRWLDAHERGAFFYAPLTQVGPLPKTKDAGAASPPEPDNEGS